VWGLDPAALAVSRDVQVLQCDACSQEHTGVRDDVAGLVGAPCLRYRCEGTLTEAQETADAELRTYYQKLYDRTELGRVRAAEHTGLLVPRRPRGPRDRPSRSAPRPERPQHALVHAHPGDGHRHRRPVGHACSCRCRPRTASYLQRIGRAGRKTGNALILTITMAAAPTIRYFFGDPRGGHGRVRSNPPGCYLDAPAHPRAPGPRVLHRSRGRADGGRPRGRPAGPPCAR
jgi:DEAD/DEAH box helicase domain-containing protein